MDIKLLAAKLVRLMENWDTEDQSGSLELAVINLLEQRHDRYRETLVRIKEHLQAQDYETHRCWFALSVAKEALGEDK